MMIRELLALKEQYRTYQGQLEAIGENLRKQCEELSRTSRGWEDQVTTLERELAETPKSPGAAEGGNGDAEGQDIAAPTVEGLQVRINTLKGMCHRLGEENRIVNEDLELAVAERNEFEIQVNARQEQIQELQARVTERDARIETLTQERDQAQAKMNSQKDELKRQARQVRDKRKYMQKVTRRAMEQKMAVINRAEQDRQALEKTRAKLEEVQRNLEKETGYVETIIEAREDAIEQKDEAQAARATALGKLDASRREAMQLKGELEAAQSERNQWQKEAIQHQATVVELRRKLEEGETGGKGQGQGFLPGVASIRQLRPGEWNERYDPPAGNEGGE